jgi:hypothetical protein
MKKKVFTIVSVIVVAFLYYFSISGLKGAENTFSAVSTVTRDTFTNCIFNSEDSEIVYWGKPELRITRNIDRYNELNFNSIHWYDATGSYRYGLPDDSLTGVQIGNFKGVLDSVKNGSLYGFYERSFLSKYCYGQRLIYEVSPMNDGMEVNNGFVYLYNMNDAYGMDSGRTVLHAKPGVQNSGFLCKNIYENLQQSDLFDFRQNDKGTWFIKPVMRIPDTTSSSRKVVRIDVISFNGVRVDSIIITADNFKDDNGSYVGNYLEKYFRLPQNEHNLQISGDTNSTDLNHGHHDRWWKWDDSCKVDFRVFWYGECEVWFDKMIVDDETANILFYPFYQSAINYRIQQEVQNFTNYGSLYSFFMDEVLISQYPCIQYIAKKMRDYNSNSRLSIAVTNYLHIHGLKNDNLDYRIYLDSIKPDFLQADHHGFYTDKINNGIKIPNVLSGHDSLIPSEWFTTPADYNNVLQNYVFGSETETAVKNSAGSLIFEIKKTRESINTYSPDTKFTMQPQIHGFIYPDTNTGLYDNGLREPTNEEIQAQGMLSIAHGVKGLCWFIYNSHNWKTASNKVKQYMLGLLNPENDTARRITNCYGQNKWTYVSEMNGKILNWLPVLENTNWVEGFSVHNQGANHYYINDIRSKAPLINGYNPCADYGGQSEYFDCTEERYWEQGFFSPENTADKSLYFMMVNRRCVPQTQPGTGDVRTLRIKFNNLPGNDENWVLTDVNTGQKITFSKTNPGPGGYLNPGETTNDIGYFKPGEGKLFKLAPLTSEGGTLVADEVISADVTIGGMIYGNGYNFVINEGKTVTFKQDAGIEMNGGVFVCGVNSDNADAVTLKGEGNNNIWKGLTLNNCDSVGIYNTNITNIKANDTAKAVMLTNCYKSEFRKNTITANNNSGGIQAVFNNVSDDPIILKIRECTFNMNSSGYSAINVISNASVTLPLNIEWCFFNAGNDTSNAVMLTEVTGGVIKNNLFSNFGKSAVFMLSTVDLYGNVILGRNNSQGIQCLAGSSISLSPSSGMYLGGYNYIRNYGTSASNIYSDNSMFYINNGQNDFDLDDTTNSKHLTGNISCFPLQFINAMKNCFHKDSVSNITATHSVLWNSTSDRVNFIFTEYSCELTPPGDFFVFQYDNYNDIVYITQGGEGSGMTKEERDMTVSDLNTNPDFAKQALKPLNILNIEENNYKALRDSVNINLRKRNYAVVEQKAMQILSQYPDSSASTGMIPKLYVSMLNLDTGGTKAGQLKTFLENLITNNTQNTGLVKTAFYHIQKCKVKLGSYQSALDGFQYIMTQNPYTYEGLIASWDYAATYLLMGSGGLSNKDNFNTEEELITPADTLINRMIKGDINSDRNTISNKNKNSDNFNQNQNQTGISNEQSRKDFYEKIKIVNNDSKTLQEEKVKILEKKIQTSNDDKTKEDAKTELTKMKQINETVKIKKPDNIKTYTIIINNDIRKVFGIGKKPAKDIITSLLPKTFELYQNYPNPFNPTTKIAFDLPRDAKVKLVIYDILGREVKTLINNEFRSAGKYISEFNGSRHASGVYFARILVNEGKDFVAVKKMVLVK